MAHWLVEGYGSDGTPATWPVEAADVTLAMAEAARAGHVALTARPAHSGDGTKRLRAADLLALMSELAALAAAKIPLADALATIAEATPRKMLRPIVEDLRKAVSSGATLSDALARYLPEGGFITGSLRTGEASGNFAGALQRITVQLQRRNATGRMIRGALVYPAILLGVTILSLLVILLGVVPNLAPLFQSAGDAAPASARILIAMADGLRAHGVSIAVGLTVVGLMGWRLHKHPAMVGLLQKTFDATPVLGPMLRASDSAAALRVAADLLEGGGTLPDALTLAAEATRATSAREALARIGSGVRTGQPLADLYRGEAALSQPVAGLIAVGAETGRLAPMMTSAAEVLEREVETASRRLIALLPPVMTLLLGGLVGGFSMAILSAILSVNDVAF
ncbi:MAG: type II secretion system F family protein [Pseudomonadota bacterium]